MTDGVAGAVPTPPGSAEAADPRVVAIGLFQAGRWAEGRRLLEPLLARQPDAPDLLQLLGAAAYREDRADEAVALLRRAVALKPDFVDALVNLGAALKLAGHPGEAVAIYRRAAALRPDLPPVWLNMGNALLAAGRPDEAVRCFQRLAGLRPDDPMPLNRMALALEAMGRVDEAVNVLCQAVIIKAGLAEGRFAIDYTHHDKARLEEAVGVLREIAGKWPDHVDAGFKLGVLLQMLGRSDEAVAAYRRTLALKPDHSPALSNLGATLRRLGRLDEAFACYEQAVAAQPDNADAYFNHGNGLQARGRLEQAIGAFKRAIELRDDFKAASSNLLTVLNYTTGLPQAAVLAEHREFARRFAAPLAAGIRPHGNRPDPERRLRVGYVSADFWRHSCAYFVLPLLANHDRDQVEVVCYAEIKHRDSYTRRIQALSDRWVEIHELADEQVAERVRADGIDILVDLTGHFSDNRLLVFARKPAPLQVTWLGYPNTTGFDTMDYRLVDAVTDPPGASEPFHTETLVRLPDGFLCYEPLAEAPPVAPLPMLAAGHVTFGSFNNTAKVTPEVVKVWAAILGRVPGSRLIIKSKGLEDEGTRRRFAGLFEAEGIDGARVELMSWALMAPEHLAVYHRVDIGLDPFPYNGTTTTCEALWMGVPVLALEGDRHAGRVGASLLTSVGLPGLSARSVDEHIVQAAALAADPVRLADLRAGLRARMAASPLCDGPAFAAKVEAAYRRMWRHWCAGRA